MTINIIGNNIFIVFMIYKYAATQSKNDRCMQYIHSYVKYAIIRKIGSVNNLGVSWIGFISYSGMNLKEIYTYYISSRLLLINVHVSETRSSRTDCQRAMKYNNIVRTRSGTENIIEIDSISHSEFYRVYVI